MDKSVYLIVSSAVIVGIVLLVLKVYDGTKNVISGTINTTNQTTEFKPENMLGQGTYTGADVIGFIKYYENENVTITVNFGGITKIVDSNNRYDDIYADVTPDTNDGVVTYIRQQAPGGTSLMERKFSMVENNKFDYTFTILP